MKILVITNFFKPIWEGGGPPRVAYSLASGLAQRGHEVVVYTTDFMNAPNDLPTNQPISMDGMIVYYFENLRKYFPQPDILPPLPYAFPFFLRNNIHHFDIIHIHEHRTMMAAYAMLLARQKGIPYIIQPHGSAPPLFQKQRVKRVFDRIVGSNGLRNANLLLALNKAEKQQLISMGLDASRIEIIPNGINPNDMLIKYGPGTFRHELGLKDEPLILYLARFHRIKGPDLLVKAFSQVIREIPRAQLVMVGPDDGYLNRVKQMVVDFGLEKYVHFPGPIYDDMNKYSAFSDADVYVLPSRYETFPVSVLEAWKMGTPTIVTDRCGLQDEINGCGSVVSFDETALSSAIIDILMNPKKAALLGERGREKVINKYAWPIIIDQLEKKYNDICNGFVAKVY